MLQNLLNFSALSLVVSALVGRKVDKVCPGDRTLIPVYLNQCHVGLLTFLNSLRDNLPPVLVVKGGSLTALKSAVVVRFI